MKEKKWVPVLGPEKQNNTRAQAREAELRAHCKIPSGQKKERRPIHQRRKFPPPREEKVAIVAVAEKKGGIPGTERPLRNTRKAKEKCRSSWEKKGETPVGKRGAMHSDTARKRKKKKRARVSRRANAKVKEWTHMLVRRGKRKKLFCQRRENPPSGKKKRNITVSLKKRKKPKMHPKGDSYSARREK